MYTVRAARPGDIAALDAIDDAFEGHAHTQVIAAAIAGGRVAVAEDDGTVVGYVRWEYFWDTIPYCYTARVLPEHQRRGLGRRLYEAVEDSLRRRGHAFWISSTEETNERSQRFHESLGFRPIGSLRELDQEVPELFSARTWDRRPIKSPPANRGAFRSAKTPAPGPILRRFTRSTAGPFGALRPG